MNTYGLDFMIIFSRNKEIELSSNDFATIREEIAKLLPEDIYNHYKQMGSTEASFMWKKSDWQEYDRQTEIMKERNKREYGKVIDFIYASDVEDRLTYGSAKQIGKIIKNNEEEILKINIKKKDLWERLIELLDDCVESHSELRWKQIDL